MIRNSFIFLDRVGAKKEKNIWKQGINSWNDFLNADSIKGIANKKYFDRQIAKASEALQRNDSAYFINKLPSVEMWRLYDEFKDEAIFLDIEPGGTGKDAGITLIGLFDGYESKTMIRGLNLDIKFLKQELSRYKLIITFNGATFDLPILKRYANIIPKVPHFDLRAACARAGLKGGLKMIEKELGIKRKNEIVEKMYGGDPLKLWKMWRASGDSHYLNILVEYNEEDVINLKQIADYVVSKLNKFKV